MRRRLIAAGIVVACVVAGLLLARCGAAASPAGITGTWKGTYLGCEQGPTGVTVVIRQGQGDKVTGTFAFHAIPSNKTVPAGEYTLAGTYVRHHLVVNGVKWVHEPGGYVMENLAGTLHGSKITGKVSGCRTFALTRS